MQGNGARPPPPAAAAACSGSIRIRVTLACAVVIATSGLSLLYTAVVVPIQLFLWDYDDPCNVFPTLHLDLFVDLFFLVPPSLLHGMPATEQSIARGAAPPLLRQHRQRSPARVLNHPHSLLRPHPFRGRTPWLPGRDSATEGSGGG